MTTTAQHNQSLFDIAVQFFGSAQAVFDVASTNQLSVTDQLVAGQEITLPEAGEHEDKDIANYHEKNNIVPVTAEDPEGITTEEALEGIGEMTIGAGFIIYN